MVNTLVVNRIYDNFYAAFETLKHDEYVPKNVIKRHLFGKYIGLTLRNAELQKILYIHYRHLICPPLVHTGSRFLLPFLSPLS